MATIQELKTQIENANALGRTNLSAKGIELPETATTYEIMQGIGDVSSGGGTSLNIAYGETAPEDKSKLWIKANEPANVSVGSDIEKVKPYIESTGTQYIDTGIIPTNHRLKMKFQCTSIENNTNIFGSYGHGAVENAITYELVWFLEKWYYAPSYHSTSTGRQNSFSPTIHPTEINEVDFNNYNNKFIINGTEVASTYGNSTAIFPLYLFSANRGDLINGVRAKMKLWYAQIYDRATQTLARDFVPAKDENGVVCLYDNVTQAYFYNQGEGVFGGGSITHELTQGNIEIKTSLTENKFNLINADKAQIKIGVGNVYIGNENNKAEPVSAYLYNGTEWKQISYGT